MVKLFDRKVVSVDSRRHRRFKSFLLLKFFVLSDPAQKSFLVNGRDISAGGASFISTLNIPLNTILKTNVYLPPLKDFIAVMANVVRVLKLRDREQYLVGINFVLIDQENKRRIDSYISTAANNPVMQKYVDRKASYFKRHLSRM